MGLLMNRDTDLKVLIESAWVGLPPAPYRSACPARNALLAGIPAVFREYLFYAGHASRYIYAKGREMIFSAWLRELSWYSFRRAKKARKVKRTRALEWE